MNAGRGAGRGARPGRRRRQVVPVGARSGPPHGRRGADHRRGRSGLLPFAEPAHRRRTADVAFDQERRSLTTPSIGSVSMAKIRVAVVYGGRSSEHGISVVSAGSVMAALDPERYEVVPIGIRPRRRVAADLGRRVVHADHRAHRAERRGRHRRGAAPRPDGEGPRYRRAAQRGAGARVGRRRLPGAARAFRRGRHDPRPVRDGRSALTWGPACSRARPPWTRSSPRSCSLAEGLEVGSYAHRATPRQPSTSPILRALSGCRCSSSPPAPARASGSPS